MFNVCFTKQLLIRCYLLTRTFDTPQVKLLLLVNTIPENSSGNSQRVTVFRCGYFTVYTDIVIGLVSHLQYVIYLRTFRSKIHHHSQQSGIQRCTVAVY